jgi:hypothetical protein
MNIKTMISAVTAALLCSSIAQAAVSEKEASKLSTTLTPLGAEMAGNADGSIPEWTGAGVENIPASYQGAGTIHPDPYSDEKPTLVIDGSNYKQHEKQLSAGQVALFETYPDTFKMPIYPTHRTTSYPDWYTKNTRNLATVAELEEGGNGVKNAHAGIPFPIPQSGVEVVWNHLLRFQGKYQEVKFTQATPDVNGRYVKDKLTRYQVFPYYIEGDTSGFLTKFIASQTAPAKVAGDSFLFHDYINPKVNARNVWRYFSGQRRVRRAPVFAYDTPVPPSYGYRTMDDFDMFFGATDKYNWELVGKQEMYIPYNNFRLQSAQLKYDDIITPSHINPEHTRYEKHRVWVVEGKLKEGQRHVYKKRVLFIDEDSWAVAVTDKYDERDQLWRVSFNYLKTYWEVPVTHEALQVHHDLVSGRYNTLPLVNEEGGTFNFTKAIPKDKFFTPASLRRLGTR